MTLRRQLFILFFTYFCISANAQDKPVIAGHQANILSVIPFQFTENGLGFGVSYEWAIDKKGMVAFYMPVMVTFDVANSNRIYDYNTGNYNTGKADAMYYAMPGVKFYPTSSHGKTKYAVGLSAVIGSGEISSNLTNIYGLNITEQVRSHFLVGGMLQQSVNVKAGKNLSISVELGMGYCAINESGSVKLNNEFLIQGGFIVGHRF